MCLMGSWPSNLAGGFTYAKEEQELGKEGVTRKEVQKMRNLWPLPDQYFSCGNCGITGPFQVYFQVHSNPEFHSSCLGFCGADPDHS